MNKLIQKLSNTFSYIKEMFKDFPVTLVSVLTGSFLLSVNILITSIIENTNGLTYSDFNPALDILLQLGATLGFFSIGAFLTETVKNMMTTLVNPCVPPQAPEAVPKKTAPQAPEAVAPKTAPQAPEAVAQKTAPQAPLPRIKKNILSAAGFTLSALLAIFWVPIIPNFLDKSIIFPTMFQKICDYIDEDRVSSFLIGYCVILFAVAVYFNFKKNEDMSFSTYCKRVFSKLFHVHLIYGVLCLGILFLVLLFTSLIAGEFETLFLPLLMLLSGGYYVAAVYHAFGKGGEEPSKFVNAMLRYVFFGLSIAAYVIIYIYMIKIVVKWDFPSNSVFSILTALFVFSVPVCYMSLDEQKNDFVHKVSRITPYLFAPFIILQILCMGMRVGEYGLTPSRYMGFAFVFFEIAYIVWYIVRRKQMQSMLLLIALMTLVCVFVPVLNSYSFSTLTQNHNLKAALESRMYEGNADSDAVIRTKAAINYLKGIGYNNEYIRTHFTETEIEQISKIVNLEVPGADDSDSFHSVYLYYQTQDYSLDISDFDSMLAFCGEEQNIDYYEGRNTTPLDLTRMQVEYDVLMAPRFGTPSEEFFFEIDATEYVKRMVEKYTETGSRDVFIDPWYTMPDGRKIYVGQLTVSIDEFSLEPYDISISGYIFE